MKFLRFSLFFITTFVSLCFCNVIPEVSKEADTKTTMAYEFNPDLFQGDIVLNEEQKQEFFNQDEKQKNKRTGRVDTKYRWPKNQQGYVIVPFVFDNVYSKFDMSIFVTSSFLNELMKKNFWAAQGERSTIRSALDVIERQTCIRFPARTNEPDYVRIIDDGGCYSFLGRIGNKQNISLARPGCVYTEIIQHEFIHALGYDHMQNHAERDNYITINWSNLPSGKSNSQFQKNNAANWSNFGTSYDYKSVMHYQDNAFAIDRSKPTMITRDPKYQKVIGYAKGPSSEDILRLRRMYKC
jgi:hypothetical protein